MKNSENHMRRDGHNKDDVPGILRDYFERKRHSHREALPLPEDDVYLLISKHLERTATPKELERLGQLCRENPSYADLLAAAQEQPKKPLRMSWFVGRLPYYAALACAAALVLVVTLQRYSGRAVPASERNVVFRGDAASADRIKRSIDKPSPTTPADAPVPRAAQGVTALALTIDDGTYQTNVVRLYEHACALLIGIDQYDPARTGLAELKEATNDVRKVAKKLGEFQFDTIEILENSAATRQNIMATAERLMCTAGQDGAFLLYFAGHGLDDQERPNTGYLVPYDGVNDEAARAERNISNRNLRELISRTQVKHAYLIADCCYAGLFRYRSGPERSVTMPDFFYLRNMTSLPVIQILAATDDNEKSIDGAFADAFVRALDNMQQYSFVPTSRLQNDVWTHVQSQVLRLRGEGFTDARGRPISMTPLFASDGGGEFIFARTNQAPLKYHPPYVTNSPPIALPGIDSATDMRVVDLLDENLDEKRVCEIIYTTTNCVRIVSLSGQVVREKYFDWPLSLTFVRDVNNDGCMDIALARAPVGSEFLDATQMPAQRFTNMLVWLLNKDLEVIKRFVRHDGIVCSNLDISSNCFISTSAMTVQTIADVNKDGRKEVIVRANTGYGGHPRDIAAFDYETGRLIWQQNLACPCGYEMDMDRDPSNDMTLFLPPSDSLGNHARLPDQSEDDLHTYVRLLRGDGVLLWRKKVGGIFSKTRALFADLNRDGTNDIIAWADGVTPHRTNCAALLRQCLAQDPAGAVLTARRILLEDCQTPADVEKLIASLEKEEGNIWVFDYAGNLRACYTNDHAVKSLHVLPDYVQGENTLLLTLSGGELLLLDPRFSELRRVRFTSDAPGVVVPEVKGILNTRFGQYVVVLQYNRYETSAYVGRISGAINPTRNYDIHVKLLDKRTLEARHDILLTKEWPRSGSFDIGVNMCDVDSDKSDEIVVLMNDSMTVYTLAPADQGTD